MNSIKTIFETIQYNVGIIIRINGIHNIFPLYYLGNIAAVYLCFHDNNFL